MEKKTVVRHVRLGEQTDAALKLLADADKRTIIGYIAVVLERHVEEAVAAGKITLPKKGRK
jgi:hypothetical protein